MSGIIFGTLFSGWKQMFGLTGRLTFSIVNLSQQIIWKLLHKMVIRPKFWFLIRLLIQLTSHCIEYLCYFVCVSYELKNDLSCKFPTAHVTFLIWHQLISNHDCLVILIYENDIMDHSFLYRERERVIFNASGAQVWAYGGWCCGGETLSPACRSIYEADLYTDPIRPLCLWYVAK